MKYGNVGAEISVIVELGNIVRRGLRRAWRNLPGPIRYIFEPLVWRVEALLECWLGGFGWAGGAMRAKSHPLMAVGPSHGDPPRVHTARLAPVPEVSVVVATHDDGVYLDTCLQSVLEQSFECWECIVVDDASLDDSLDVALRYAERDGRFRVVRQDCNLGLAATRNTGIARVRGRFVTMLDGDDFLFREGLGSRYQIAVCAKDISVAGSWCDGMYVPEWAGLDYRASAGGSGKTIDYTTGKGENQVLSTSPMVRTDVVRSLGGFDPSFHVAEDFEFWSRLFRNGFKLLGTGSVGVAYRQKRTSLISSNPLLHVRNSCRVYSYLSRRLETAARSAMATRPFIDPVAGIPDAKRIVFRVVQFLTYAVVAGDQQQIDGIAAFLTGDTPPRRGVVERAVMGALRRHSYRVGGLTWGEKRNVFGKVLRAIAERKQNPHMESVYHRGEIDLSRVAPDARNPHHAPRVRRREIRAGHCHAPWEVILDPTSMSSADDLLTLGRELVEAGRSVAILRADGSANGYRRAQSEGIPVVEPPSGSVRLTITSSPRSPRTRARRHLAISTEPWISFAEEISRPDTTIVRCEWEARWRSELPNVHICGWLSRTSRVMAGGSRIDTILVLRAPGTKCCLAAADLSENYGDVCDFVFGPGLDAEPGNIVTTARIPVVMPRVRAVIVLGSAVPMDAIVTGTPVIVIGDPPTCTPDDVTFAALDQLNDAINAAGPAQPEPSIKFGLDQQLHVVNQLLQ